MDSSKPLSMKFSGHSRSKNQLTFSYEISDLRFQTSIWYENVDFYALESRWGLEFMTNIYFHIGALDATKFVSLRPNSLDWGEYNRFVTPAFALLWEKVIKGVWAQWRYENDAPTYFGPAFQAHGSAMTPISLTPGPTQS